KEEFSFLASLLTDDRVVTAPDRTPPCPLQMCDVVLGLLIEYTGQNVLDYGYVSNIDNRGAEHIVVGRFRFPTGETRAVALVKFGFWRLKQSVKANDTARNPGSHLPPAGSPRK